jgi:hypothetical protein
MGPPTEKKRKNQNSPLGSLGPWIGDKLSLGRYIWEYAPTIGQFYRVKTETLTITTE